MQSSQPTREKLFDAEYLRDIEEAEEHFMKHTVPLLRTPEQVRADGLEMVEIMKQWAEEDAANGGVYISPYRGQKTNQIQTLQYQQKQKPGFTSLRYRLRGPYRNRKP